MNTIIGILLYLQVIASPSTITSSEIQRDRIRYHNQIEAIRVNPIQVNQILHDFQPQIDNIIIIIDDSQMD
ncbi:MAG: hypothetical protein SGJ04_08575 [Bacteroidota bacterium]|nr:hypothetical protein [Bacteroidota bacterium]